MICEEQATDSKRTKRLKENKIFNYVWIPFYNEFYVFLITYLWSYFYIIPCWNPSWKQLCSVHFSLWFRTVGRTIVLILQGRQLSADHAPSRGLGGSKLHQQSSQQSFLLRAQLQEGVFCHLFPAKLIPFQSSVAGRDWIFSFWLIVPNAVQYEKVTLISLSDCYNGVL